MKAYATERDYVYRHAAALLDSSLDNGDEWLYNNDAGELATLAVRLRRTKALRALVDELYRRGTRMEAGRDPV